MAGADRRLSGSGRLQIRIRDIPEWAKWLNDASKKTGQDASEIIADAVEQWAKRKKLDPPRDR